MPAQDLIPPSTEKIIEQVIVVLSLPLKNRNSQGKYSRGNQWPKKCYTREDRSSQSWMRVMRGKEDCLNRNTTQAFTEIQFNNCVLNFCLGLKNISSTFYKSTVEAFVHYITECPLYKELGKISFPELSSRNKTHIKIKFGIFFLIKQYKLYEVMDFSESERCWKSTSPAFSKVHLRYYEEKHEFN
jgi:hypothetical protein